MLCVSCSFNQVLAPQKIPIVGHLHLLKQPIQRTLHSLSEKHGPIFSLKLGSRLAVFISSPSAVDECFTKNDIVLANRPPFLMTKYLNYNTTTMGSVEYGDHWRNLRRISTLEIFSSARLTSLFSIRREEVMALLRRLHSVSRHGNYAKVELRSMLLDLTSNIIMRMVAGKRYYGVDVNEIEEGRILREILEEFLAYIAIINVGDLIPMLWWGDITGHLKKLDRLSKKMDVFLQGLVDEHRDDRDRNTMINRFLALQEEQPEYYTDDIIKGHVLELLIGGTETSATAMEWALANLLNHPEVLKKAKAEVDAQVGDRLIEESDFAKLHYLQSIISENLRLCPVTPLIPPHMPSSDCTIGGYHVPAGTILFVNAWSLHRDPTLWDEPTSFKPERFESAGRVDACKFIPFGMGRRACPGDGLANRVMTLTLGSLIQCFELERVGENKIDMTEKTAMTMFKVEPLELMCRARPILDMLLSLSGQKI
ncbi:PREDICTED: cytochrome P450 81E8-like isoform X3 [Populus euphratica]|uniref:Cytochrome P450 81E8-like isoform X3 n=1 Tax=Populus euphratica TaxID=75702 RepID=A0AAJ6VI87_POPEU|nr:PREDICTED: cytochrome P450 81E8-like isoform X3 [Populus euphratica]